jgi:hypothetical protein
MNSLLLRAAIFWVLFLTAAVPGKAITFNNTWDPSINTYLPAADVTPFKNAVIYAEQQYQNLFTDAVTINITFRVRPGTTTLGGSLTSFQSTDFAEVKAALTASAVSPSDFSSVANLPPSDPLAKPGTWSMPTAEAKVLGLRAAANPSSDGTISFGAGNPFTYDPANRKVVGKYDFIGIVLHELAEVMGKNTSIDGVPAGASPFDLFRYTVASVISLNPNATNVYFSVDGGVTKLNFFNSDPAGDLMDWAGPAPDAFNAFGPTNEQDDLTPSDVIAMDVIGYTPVTYMINTSASPLAGGSTSGGGRIVSGLSVTVTASPAANYSFVNWTENGVEVSTSASYTFTASVNRTLVANFVLASANANLASLTPSGGALTPAFAINTTGYSIGLGKTALTFRLTPVVLQAGATVTVNGIAVASGSASGPTALVVGPNVFNVVVTAPNGFTTKTYTVTVTRSNLTPPMDLNGDTVNDFVFQNTAGQLAVWYMNGSGSIATAGYLYNGSLGDWKLMGRADLNNDGFTDLVFQNTAGQVYAWYMDGAGNIGSSGFIYSGALADWRIVGIADMNGDGNADLVFQNGIGQVVVWYLNGGGGILAGVYLYNGGLGEWRIGGVGDMNGDGKADIVFQNTAGQVYAWYMDGAGNIGSSSFLYPNGLGDWRLKGIADLNGDGNPDLIYQNTAGQVVGWYMNAAGGIIAGVYVTTISLGEWRVH